jgi:hypothetical protein
MLAGLARRAAEKGITFGDIGPVELKGVSGTVHLLRAFPGRD